MIGVSFDNPLATGSFIDLIFVLIDIIFTIGIPIAMLFILYGAFLFMTSAGNEQKLNQAKGAIMWAMVGFGLLLAAKGIVVWICGFFGAGC